MIVVAPCDSTRPLARGTGGLPKSPEYRRRGPRDEQPRMPASARRESVRACVPGGALGRRRVGVARQCAALYRRGGCGRRLHAGGGNHGRPAQGIAAASSSAGPWRPHYPQTSRIEPRGVLFGSERVGLSNEDLSHCHWLMRIPTREENISMNLGQAVAICLYELARSGKARAGIGCEKGAGQRRGCRADDGNAE